MIALKDRSGRPRRWVRMFDMPDYVASVVLGLGQPATESQQCTFLLGMSKSATTRFRPGELTAILDVAAETPLAAASLVEHVVRSTAGEAGIKVDRMIEAVAIESDRYLARNADW